MRAFIILCCFAVAAHAASVGYDYGVQGGSGSLSGGGFVSGGGLASDGGLSSGALGGDAGGFVSGGAAQLSQPIQSVQPVNEFVKEFYSFSAPEGEFEQPRDYSQVSNSLKKSLRVVFIKGPESHGLENAAVQLAKHASDDRTAIYVLTKQADASELANKLNSLNHHSASKPEVHFVKYRTQSDAENAQRAIQQQYDSLGGSSVSHNGGVAPVLNFASQGPSKVASNGGAGGSLGSGVVSGGVSGGSGSSGYLPPNLRV